MPSTDQGSRKIKSTATIFAIIQTLQELDGAGVTEVADHVGVTKGAVHAHLASLVELGYVVRHGDRYHIGLKFLDHGQYAKRRQCVDEVAQPVLDQLAEDTGELSWLLVEEGGKAVYLSKSLGDRGVQTKERVGTRTHMHCLASGKAMLSQMSQQRVEEIIARHGLPRLTDQTVTDAETLFDELHQIREEGVAFNRDEEIDGLRAVASPIVANDELHGAICVVGPQNRLKGGWFNSELPDMVLGASNEIELKITYA